ncbi:MAG: carbohydrate ABC transporter permease, partial [Caldilineaceae bacterium]
MSQLTTTQTEAALPASMAKTSHKRGSTRARHNNIAGYIFISPWLISLFAFTLIPIIASFVLSFTDYDVLSRGWPEWVGMKNYVRMFTTDARFMKSLRATFYYVFTAVPLRLAFALFVAM